MKEQINTEKRRNFITSAAAGGLGVFLTSLLPFHRSKAKSASIETENKPLHATPHPLAVKRTKKGGI
jgi:hypothetical protein